MEMAFAMFAFDAKSMLLPSNMLFLATVLVLPITILLPIAITLSVLVTTLLVPAVKTRLVFLTLLSAPLTAV